MAFTLVPPFAQNLCDNGINPQYDFVNIIIKFNILCNLVHTAMKINATLKVFSMGIGMLCFTFKTQASWKRRVSEGGVTRPGRLF